MTALIPGDLLECHECHVPRGHACPLLNAAVILCAAPPMCPLPLPAPAQPKNLLLPGNGRGGHKSRRGSGRDASCAVGAQRRHCCFQSGMACLSHPRDAHDSNNSSNHSRSSRSRSLEWRSSGNKRQRMAGSRGARISGAAIPPTREGAAGSGGRGRGGSRTAQGDLI